MHKYNIPALLFIFWLSIVNANGQIKLSAKKTKKNTVYLQLIGSTNNLYGVGYERKMYVHKNWEAYTKIGLTYLPLPLILNDGYRTCGAHIETGGRWGNERNKLELGVSFCYNYWYWGKKLKFENPTYSEDGNTDLKMLTLNVGYRRISKNQFWFYDFVLTTSHILDRYQKNDTYDNKWLVGGFGIGAGIQF